MRNCIIILLTGLTVLALASCKPREKCPAYGQQNTQYPTSKPA